MPYCQLCGKFIKFQKGKTLCYDCWKKKHPSKTSKEENDNKDNSKFFTYVLKINSQNKYYIGYSNSLRRRLWEHRNGEVQETKGLEPILVYFEIFSSKEKALFREKELKSFSVYKITEMIIEFSDLIKELDK